MANRSETFGRLLKAGIGSIATCAGKNTPLIDEELGGTLGLSAAAIQRYKTGYIPTEQQTIEVLAKACVERGLLGRDWLKQFLYVARYPAPDALIRQLFPSEVPRIQPPRMYHNLPAPTYNQFVMREQAFSEAIDGLQQRSAVVLITGLGGNGKTSLAREVAGRCLKDSIDAPHFDAVVWISDRPREGSTNLTVVLDEIARTLDYPGITQLSHDEKLYEVGQLLRRQRILIVIDNFETITDGSLLTWLTRLPEPSKAIVTTREYLREFRRGCWPVELRGMSEAEAHALIQQRLRTLRFGAQLPDQSQIEPLVAATGGNPKAIEIALGILKHERRPLQQVVDDLYAARGELFDDLFTRAWALLDEAARRVLFAVTFFSDSASSSALSTTADVTGFAFDRAMERLVDLALIDLQQVDLLVEPRYTLHPLVRAFAVAKLREQPTFEEMVQIRRLDWYVHFVADIGSCWNSIDKLDLLDPEHQMIYEVIKWALHHRRYADVYKLVKGVRYYYYVRGAWDKRLLVDMIHARAARNDHNQVEETKALAYYIHIVSRQHDLSAAERYLPRMCEQMQALHLPEGVYSTCQQAIALYEMAKGDLAAARTAWLSSMRESDPRVYVATRRWLALCLYKQGERVAARQLFAESLQDARRHGFKRASTLHQLGLAAIDLDDGDIESAANYLSSAMHQVQQYHSSADIAEIEYLYARFHILQGDYLAAQSAIDQAINLFERTGLRDDLAKARIFRDTWMHNLATHSAAR